MKVITFNKGSSINLKHYTYCDEYHNRCNIYRDRFGNIKKTMQNFYYRYLADGSKISVSDSAGNGFLYLGAARFEYDADGTSFESLPFGGGRIVSSSNGYEPQYHFTDHLGSTRVVATYDNGWTDIQRKNYSPFGKEWETPAKSNTSWLRRITSPRRC